MMSKLLIGILAILIVVPVFAQTSGTHRPAFEVASIKLHAGAGPGPDLAGFQHIPGSPRMDMM